MNESWLIVGLVILALGCELYLRWDRKAPRRDPVIGTDQIRHERIAQLEVSQRQAVGKAPATLSTPAKKGFDSRRHTILPMMDRRKQQAGR